MCIFKVAEIPHHKIQCSYLKIIRQPESIMSKIAATHNYIY